MMKLLIIPGSTRRAAFSKQLAKAVAMAPTAGVSMTVVDLS